MPDTNNMKVSVVLPVYNGEDNVAAAIESVLRQTYQNLELILVNDCSTDGTLEIMKKYASSDVRIKIVNNQFNLKLPRALNAGFEQADGRYYTWTSDDNLYKENAIERMMGILEENPELDLVYADFTDIDADGNELSGVKLGEPMDLLTGNQIGACFLYTGRVAKKVGDYDPNLFLAEDYDYWIRVWRAGKIKHIKENLYYYRRHAGSLSETKKHLVGMQTYRTLEKNFLFLYSAAKTRKDRHALTKQMIRCRGKNGRNELLRMMRKFDKSYVQKEQIKDKLRGTPFWGLLRRIKRRLG